MFRLAYSISPVRIVSVLLVAVRPNTLTPPECKPIVRVDADRGVIVAKRAGVAVDLEIAY